MSAYALGSRSPIEVGDKLRGNDNSPQMLVILVPDPVRDRPQRRSRQDRDWSMLKAHERALIVFPL